MSLDKYIRIARTIKDATDCSIEEAVNNPAIPKEFKGLLQQKFEKEQLIILRDPYMIEDPNREHIEWLPWIDRADWYYWPRLRNYLIDTKGWPTATIRSIDDATDQILGAMENPVGNEEFDTRGLAVGYIQSGKTVNYTSLIAKSVDTGYRLIIVLAGIHNSLRYQTQIRLDKELVGMINGLSLGVGRPSPDKEWHTFTKADLQNGEFDPGNASAAALNGNNPVLMVVKKNSNVLRRLISWLNTTHQHTRRNLPCLIIDDEADQASINNGGNRPIDWDPSELIDDESPSSINGLIRELLNLFTKKAYIAYTATPFANVLIDHTAEDIRSGRDLYPRSFIMALPRPYGYYGAEEIFGSVENENSGLNIIRHIPKQDVSQLVPANRLEVETFQPSIPVTLRQSILDFILSGAAYIHRGFGDKPASMLIHTSYRTSIQEKLAELVQEEILRLREEWRYSRDNNKLIKQFEERWEDEFRPLTRSKAINFDVPFNGIVENISTFLEQIKVMQLHSNSEDEIDYEIDPTLKVIVIGGNRLSRGLTLEGLLTSYFVRTSHRFSYDTLMQMGRWFGFRDGYVDLTRIYTTPLLERWFRDLSTVEEEIHREIARYGREKNLTPLKVGVKIRQHPAMLVTSPLKMRSAQDVRVSFENQVVQTTSFPFNNNNWLKKNLVATQEFLNRLGMPNEGIGTNRPVWYLQHPSMVLDFLQTYQTDDEATRVRSDLLVDYILQQNNCDELIHWTVAVVGRKNLKKSLGKIDLHIQGCEKINLYERIKMKGINSLKAIVLPEDHSVGLTKEQLIIARENIGNLGISRLEALRHLRSPKEGVLLIYPISKYSGHELSNNENNKREPIFQKPNKGEHIIGIAMIFPRSYTTAAIEYITGSVGLDS